MDINETLNAANEVRQVKMSKFVPNLARIDSLNKRLNEAMVHNKLPNKELNQPKLTKYIAKDNMVRYDRTYLIPNFWRF